MDVGNGSGKESMMVWVRNEEILGRLMVSSFLRLSIFLCFFRDFI